jgi:transcriptional regulator with XRE-family HTH domain
MNSIEDIIATNIMRLRKSLGVTQLVLSEKSGITQGMLSDIENSRSNPSIKTLEKLAQALNVSVLELMKDPDIHNQSLKDKLEAIEQLSEEKRKVLETVLEALLHEEQLQKLINKKHQ